MAANKNNVTKRVDVSRPLTYVEGDTNFQELKNVIDDQQTFESQQNTLNSTYESDISGLRTDVDADAQDLLDHENASDPHPQYATDTRVDGIEGRVTTNETDIGELNDELVQPVATFNNVADMKASIVLSIGRKCRTLGYYTPGDGGGNDYEVVAAGTGTDDGGSFIDLSGSGLQAKGLFLDGAPRASQLGADRSIAKDQDSTANTAAINNLFTYVGTQVSAGEKVTALVDGSYVVNGTLTFSEEFMRVDFRGYMYASDDFPLGSYMISAEANNSSIHDFKMRGNYLASGIDVVGGGVQVHDPIMRNIKGVGIRLEGAFGDSNVHNPSISEIGLGDPLFTNDANFSSIGIYFNRADCNLYGGVTAWLGTCLYFGPNARTTWVRGHHPFNGRPATPPNPRVNPKLIVSEGVGIFLKDCYMDNGLIEILFPSFEMDDCSFLISDERVTLTEAAVVQVKANGQSNPYQFRFASRFTEMPAGYSLVKYMDDGGDSWGGDYNTAHAGLTETNSGVHTTNGDIIVHHRSDDNRDYQSIHKPNGYIQRRYSIGSASSDVTERYGNGYMQLNAASIQCGGNTRPRDHNTFTLGSSGQRWTEVFAVNGTINSSDEREKEQVRELSEAERAVATKLKGLLRAYRRTDAVEKKGADGARWHFGIMAQQLKKTFEEEGLDAHDYGMFCYDEWEDEDGNRVDLYGVRYEELLVFIINAM